jgi:SAM-dependent methyltransferase
VDERGNLVGLGITRKLLRLISRKNFKEKYFCLICNHRVGAFLPYRGGQKGLPPLMIALEGIGSDVVHFECPWCGCHDRERHLLMYMRATGLFESLSNKTVLHFAPERRLSPLIAAQKPLRYIRCDLHPQTPDIEKIDISAIPSPAESFDLVIANHVLEHVADDQAALAEIHRVLKPGGYAILQTPYSAKLHHTWSDLGIDTDMARLQAYGQEDHVRLFGRDIFERFTASGLGSCVSTHDQLLQEYDARKYGVNAKEPFFLFQRLV